MRELEFENLNKFTVGAFRWGRSLYRHIFLVAAFDVENSLPRLLCKALELRHKYLMFVRQSWLPVLHRHLPNRLPYRLSIFAPG